MSQKNYTTEDGVKHEEWSDGKGQSSHTKFGKKEETTDYYKKGKFVGRDISRADKQVTFDMKRGKFSAFLSNLISPDRGGRLGKVSDFSVSEERAAVNTKLRGILKDGSLSSAEKQAKMRAVAAEYRSGRK